MNEDRKGSEIDIMQLLSALLSKWYVILVGAVLGGLILFGYTSVFVTPIYKASAMMYVNNSTLSVGSAKVNISSGDITASKSLVDSYRVILGTRLTLEDVIAKSGVSYSYGQLKKMVSAASVNDTEIFSITVSSPDPEEAYKIANTIVSVLPTKISGIIDGASVRTVDLAVVPTSPSSPSYTKNVAIGVLLGIIVGAGYVLLIEFFDDNVKTEDWLTTTFGEEIPLLAVVPDVDQKNSDKNNKYGRYYTSQYSSTRTKSKK